MERPTVTVLPVWTDNYSYLVTLGDVALAIDPADAGAFSTPVTHVALTHHHGDHTAGCAGLVARDGCELLDAPSERFEFGGVEIRAIPTPGHTADHRAFYIPSAESVFTGDALFVCGCGRVQPGLYARMWESLVALRSLPEATHVYAGHNYTVENIAFALSLEPGNGQLAAALSAAREADATRQPTVPSSMAEETMLNPFLRCDDADFCRTVGLPELPPEEAFEQMRRQKDRW